VIFGGAGAAGVVSGGEGAGGGVCATAGRLGGVTFGGAGAGFHGGKDKSPSEIEGTSKEAITTLGSKSNKGALLAGGAYMGGGT
jgi:hypothetical protein